MTKGTLSKVKNPNNQETEYTYDLAKRAIKTESTADGKTYRSQNTYAADKLVKVAHNTDSDAGVSVEYNFSYDDLGRQTTVAVGTQNLSTTHYNNDGTVSEIIYGNNETSLSPAAQSVRYSYDEFKRLKGVQFDDDTDDAYKYDYAANGQVGRLTDISLNRTYTSEYDTADRPMRMIQKQNGEHLYTGQVEYDKYNNLKTFKEKVGPSETSVAYRTDFDYDRENKPTLLTYGDEDHFVGYEYDSIGRMLTRTVKLGVSEQESSYEYVAGNNGTGNTTSLISKITHPHAEYEYTYDEMGNIVSWKQSAQTTVSYVYDHMGQLVRVNDPTDLAGGSGGTTWMYEYDRGGNILSKTRYPYTVETPVGDGVTITYDYDSVWKDKLVSLSDGSVIQNIDYDDIGNPLSDGAWTYTWEKGRQLKQMSNTAKTITFDYNHEGLRVRKTVNDTTDGIIITNYTLHGKNIVHMTRKNSDETINDSLHFFYDASNRPAIVEFNEVKYAYVHDLQGDICQIVDANGTVVVEYTYDAWGKVLNVTGSMASTLGTIQPFRYRGYVYDVETGLYYLRSRYYNPDIGKFLNEDAYALFNLYNYADNNPISRLDESGCESIPVPYPVYFDPSLIYGLLSSLTISSAPTVPWVAAIMYVFTPTPTANDEAVWDYLRTQDAYHDLVESLSISKEKGNLNIHKPRTPTNDHHIVCAFGISSE